MGRATETAYRFSVNVCEKIKNCIYDILTLNDFLRATFEFEFEYLYVFHI